MWNPIRRLFSQHSLDGSEVQHALNRAFSPEISRPEPACERVSTDEDMDAKIEKLNLKDNDIVMCRVTTWPRQSRLVEAVARTGRANVTILYVSDKFDVEVLDEGSRHRLFDAMRARELDEAIQKHDKERAAIKQQEEQRSRSGQVPGVVTDIWGRETAQLISQITIMRHPDSEPEPIGVFCILGYAPLRVRLMQNTSNELFAVAAIGRRPYRVTVEYRDGRTEVFEQPELLWRLGSHSQTSYNPANPRHWMGIAGGNLDFMLLPEASDISLEEPRLKLDYMNICIP